MSNLSKIVETQAKFFKPFIQELMEDDRMDRADFEYKEKKENLIDEGIEESEAEDMASWALENDVPEIDNISQEFRKAKQETENDIDQKEQDYRRAIGVN